MEVKAPPNNNGQFKSRLQEYTQKSGLPLPYYHTVNEGQPHAPQFRSTVEVDGTTYTSPSRFTTRKAAEHDIAKIALESISRKIETEGVPLIQADTKFCKSILHEYVVKVNLERPTYTTSQVEGILPVFISSLKFNGQTYTGEPAKSKKEAEQMVARATIESILATSDTRTLMSEIIRSKGKLYAAFNKRDSSSGLALQNSVPPVHQGQNNSDYTIIGKYVFEISANNKIPGNRSPGGEQVYKTETFISEAQETQQRYTCERNHETNGNGNPQPSLLQCGSLATTTGNMSNTSDVYLMHGQINAQGSQLGESATSESASILSPCHGMKRSDTNDSGECGSKRARSVEQPPTASANPESSPKNLPNEE